MFKKDFFSINESLGKVAYTVSIVFLIVSLFPIIFIVGNSLKDTGQMSKVPITIFPENTRSISIVLNYDDYSDLSESELLDLIKRDTSQIIYAVPYNLGQDGIYETKVYAEIDNKVIYYIRSHTMETNMELQYGTYIKSNPYDANSILRKDKYLETLEIINYDYNSEGLNIDYDYSEFNSSDLQDNIIEFLVTADRYEISGTLKGLYESSNFLLAIENYVYYYRIPIAAWGQNSSLIANFSFFAFLLNTIIVVVWAIFIQFFLGTLTGFGLSKLLPKKTSNIIMLVFLSTMMIPFVSIMIPQFRMFKSMGMYNNYWALLIPHLIPYGYYVFLFKRFFDQIPIDYFEAAKIDGAGDWYLYTRICVPLSGPIISLVAVTTFLSNWNDFFWAYLVSENQSLWTLNVALYNLSNMNGMKSSFIFGISFVSLIPLLMIILIFSNKIKSGVVGGGIKG